MTLAPRSAQLPDSPHRDSLDPAPTPSSQDQRLLKALATAMVNHPRATMGELAELAGVSRATLNRHCGTREGLKRRLESHARSTLERLTHSAALQRLEPREALRELIREHLAQRDLLALLMFEQNPGRQLAVLCRSPGRLLPARPAEACVPYRYQRGDLQRTLHRPDLRHGRCRAPRSRGQCRVVRHAGGAVPAWRVEPRTTCQPLSGRQLPPASTVSHTFTRSTPAASMYH